MTPDIEQALFVVPARAASVGLPRKVVLDVAGRPLLWYTTEFLRRVAPIENIAVVTDDNEVEELASQQGVRSIREPFVPPGQANAVGAVQHCVCELQARGLAWPYTVIVQPTQPVRTLQLLQRSLARLRASSAADDTIDGCLTVTAVDSPGLQLRRDGSGRLTSWLSTPGIRQDMQPVYRVSGCYFIMRTDRFLAKCHDPQFLYENLSWVTQEHPSFPWVDIDTERDGLQFELLLNAGHWSLDLAVIPDKEADAGQGEHQSQPVTESEPI